MNRRSFLKGLLACTALIPSIALSKGKLGEIGFIDGGVRLVKSKITVEDIENAVSMMNKKALGPIVSASANHNYLNMRGRW